MSKTTIARAGLIDGLPTSYVTSYVIKQEKICKTCQNYIKQKQIDRNEIICTEDFDFYHKDCLKKANINYEHQKPNDKSSVIHLKKN